MKKTISELRRFIRSVIRENVSGKYISLDELRSNFSEAYDALEMARAGFEPLDDEDQVTPIEEITFWIEPSGSDGTYVDLPGYPHMNLGMKDPRDMQSLYWDGEVWG